MPKTKTSRKGIKNYTTEIKVEKTISEIEVLLTKYGAKKILKEYDDYGSIKYLTFMIKYNSSFVPIRLPSEPDKVLIMLNEKVDAGVIPKRYRNDKTQATRIMWRIILDWIDAQMTMVEIGQKTLLQIFLADVCPVGAERPYFDRFITNDLPQYMIEDNSEK